MKENNFSLLLKKQNIKDNVSKLEEVLSNSESTSDPVSFSSSNSSQSSHSLKFSSCDKPPSDSYKFVFTEFPSFSPPGIQKIKVNSTRNLDFSKSSPPTFSSNFPRQRFFFNFSVPDDNEKQPNFLHFNNFARGDDPKYCPGSADNFFFQPPSNFPNLPTGNSNFRTPDSSKNMKPPISSFSCQQKTDVSSNSSWNSTAFQPYTTPLCNKSPGYIFKSTTKGRPPYHSPSPLSNTTPDKPKEASHKSNLGLFTHSTNSKTDLNNCGVQSSIPLEDHICKNNSSVFNFSQNLKHQSESITNAVTTHIFRDTSMERPSSAGVKNSQDVRFSLSDLSSNLSSADNNVPMVNKFALQGRSKYSKRKRTFSSGIHTTVHMSTMPVQLSSHLDSVSASSPSTTSFKNQEFTTQELPVNFEFPRSYTSCKDESSPLLFSSPGTSSTPLNYVLRRAQKLAHRKKLSFDAGKNLNCYTTEKTYSSTSNYASFPASNQVSAEDKDGANINALAEISKLKESQPLMYLKDFSPEAARDGASVPSVDFVKQLQNSSGSSFSYLQGYKERESVTIKFDTNSLFKSEESSKIPSEINNVKACFEADFCFSPFSSPLEFNNKAMCSKSVNKQPIQAVKPVKFTFSPIPSFKVNGIVPQFSRTVNMNSEKSGEGVLQSNVNEDFERTKSEGIALYKSQMYEEAARKFTDALLTIKCGAHLKHKATCLHNRALSYFKLNDLSKAIEDWSEALKIDPFYHKAELFQADALVKFGRLDTVSHIYKRLRNCLLAPELDVLLQERLVVFEKVTDLEAKVALAIENAQKSERDGLVLSVGFFSCQELLKVCSHSVEFMTQKATLLRLTGKVLEAYDYIKKLYSDDKNKCVPLLWKEYGYCIYYSCFFDDRSPNFEEFSSFLSTLRLSNFSKNLSEVFAELLELESKMGKMKLKKLEAKKFYANQLYIQAIECYTECLNFDPAHSFYNAIIYQNRAQCKYNLSLYPESFTDCSSSISENPHYLKPRLFELKLLVQLERFAHLLEKAVLLLKAFPDNKEVKKMHVYVVQQLQLRRERVEREVEKGFSEKTHYDVLEISRTASELEIKKAYRVKALMWHPDKHVEKSEEERLFAAAYFRHVQQAFDVLGNRDTRKAYDRELLFKNRRSTHNFGQTYYKGSAHYSDTGKKK